ncbi:tetratricopeptide repeat protein [candidate division WOR-3 bacterium]|nr:tetratricopeptide repeat protein [candidate division WOR-3 bacterium]MCK4527940.1 tetratricopeptide repeat protein [candidate division WOR-3 bacterium]
MFKKIKSRLKDIEIRLNKKEKVEKDLNLILKNIKEVKAEIIRLENKTRELLKNAKQKKEIETKPIDVKRFLSKIQSSRINVETLLDRSWNYIVLGKYKEAIKELKKAKQMDSKKIQVYNLLGWAYINIEDFSEAARNFQEVIKMDPKNEMAQANLGYINYKQGLYGEAIERLSNITKKAKDKEAILYASFYLGLVYFEREMYVDAIEFFNKAITIGPNLYEAFYYLGKTYKKLKLDNLAHQTWDRLIESNQKSIWAKKAKEERNGQ